MDSREHEELVVVFDDLCVYINNEKYYDDESMADAIKAIEGAYRSIKVIKEKYER